MQSRCISAGPPCIWVQKYISNKSADKVTTMERHGRISMGKYKIKIPTAKTEVLLKILV